MKAVAQIFLLVVLVLSCTVSTCGQETLWKELYSKTTTLYQQGWYSEAARVAEEAFTVAEKTFGLGHLTVAQSLNSLALVYDAQGRYSEAESLYKRALTVGEKALGKNHPLVPTLLNNLAEIYRIQGKYAKAEPLHKRALGINEKALGPSTPMWRLSARIWHSFTGRSAKKMKPKDSKNVREESDPINAGNRSLVCQ